MNNQSYNITKFLKIHPRFIIDCDWCQVIKYYKLKERLHQVFNDKKKAAEEIKNFFINFVEVIKIPPDINSASQRPSYRLQIYDWVQHEWKTRYTIYTCFGMMDINMIKGEPNFYGMNYNDLHFEGFSKFYDYGWYVKPKTGFELTGKSLRNRTAKRNDDEFIYKADKLYKQDMIKALEKNYIYERYSKTTVKNMDRYKLYKLLNNM